VAVYVDELFMTWRVCCVFKL